MHDTPLRELEVAPSGLGVLCNSHLVPFQRSANVARVTVLVLYEPTAIQAVLDVHETADRNPLTTNGAGSDCMLHAAAVAASAATLHSAAGSIAAATRSRTTARE